MKNVLFIFILVLTFSIPAFAQQVAGFAGTWILDEESTFDSERERTAVSDYVMDISEDNEAFLIKISYSMDKRPVLYQLKLFKDGRGETNTVMGTVTETSETEVIGRKIARKYVRSGPLGGSKATGTDEFLLSKDGLKLIRRRMPEIAANGPASKIPGGRESLIAASTPPSLVFKRKL